MTNNPYGIAALWSGGDPVIRTVAVLLLLMSIASWFIIVTRVWRVVKLRRSARASADFWHAHSFGEGLHMLGGDAEGNPFRHLAEEGKAAIDHHASNREDLHGQISLAEWLTESLRGAIDESAERLQSGLSVLASVGATAPFVGLFGTVWGIYHALVGIGVAGQASIDKVAGPVGEALIMTAFGLAVAVPAVMGYNWLIRRNKTVMERIRAFSGDVHNVLLAGKR